MILYPDVQARVHAEINQVVMHDKMPSIDDRPSLPYLDAVLREVLRWCPPIPLGMAHATINDDFYGGYFIPKVRYMTRGCIDLSVVQLGTMVMV
ncbi:cytochrome P450, partial [Suillus plorans]